MLGKFNGWDWEDSWQTLVILVLLCIGSMIGCAIFSNHHIDEYYLQTLDSYTCVMGHRQWVPDTLEVCFINPNDAVDAIQKLKK